ncbi:MAG: flagellar hook-associated protein FlgK [Gemmatimonadales bacterium]
MPSINSLLSIARSAIVAQQAAVEVAGHNIANAQTPGYTRQQLDVTPSTPLQTPTATYGTGVSIVNVSSVRDSLLDQEARTQSAPAANYQAQSDLLGRVEGIFGEPSSDGLASTIDAFWNSWSDLASNPASASAKTVVQQRGTMLAATFNQYAKQLSDLSASTRSDAADAVKQANQITTQVAAINAQIVPAESGGKSANDLRDQRDLLLDKLSQLVPVQVINRADGSDQVMMGGMPLVDGSSAHALSLGGGLPLTLNRSGDPEALRAVGGKIGALLDAANTSLPNATASLDAIASSVITDVNALHEAGWSPPAGAAGNWNPATPPTGSAVDFFDPAPAFGTAANIRLSATVASDASSIAAGNALNAPGNNATALAIAGLKDFSPSAPGNSIGGAYQALVATVASAKSSADSSATVYDTLSKQAEQRRQSVSGVSTDEELISLINHQQAYVAASKLIQTVNEMSQALLDIKK